MRQVLGRGSPKNQILLQQGELLNTSNGEAAVGLSEEVLVGSFFKGGFIQLMKNLPVTAAGVCFSCSVNTTRGQTFFPYNQTLTNFGLMSQ